MKPNRVEDQHVWKQELNRQSEKLQLEQQADAEMEQRRLKELHWMRCPKCGQKLVTENHGPVEIGLCPNCRGFGWMRTNWRPS
jgi:uncharacterized protein with PIN domain